MRSGSLPRRNTLHFTVHVCPILAGGTSGAYLGEFVIRTHNNFNCTLNIGNATCKLFILMSWIIFNLYIFRFKIKRRSQSEVMSCLRFMVRIWESYLLGENLKIMPEDSQKKFERLFHVISFFFSSSILTTFCVDVMVFHHILFERLRWEFTKENKNVRQ